MYELLTTGIKIVYIKYENDNKNLDTRSTVDFFWTLLVDIISGGSLQYAV